jgi:hypothetical protein
MKERSQLAERLHAWIPRPAIGLLLFAGLLAMTVVLSGSGSTGDRGGVASVRAPEVPALNAVTASAPSPGETTKGAFQVVGIEERAALQGVRETRKKVRCIGCGVVESVYRSDRPERGVGVCFSDEWASALIAIAADERGTYSAISTVGAIAATINAERPGSGPLAALSKHQIVVRLVDGSRVVFNEPTARTLQAGDRIVVIAGVPAAVL